MSDDQHWCPQCPEKDPPPWLAARDARVAATARADALTEAARISENMTQAARHNADNHLLSGFARKLAAALRAATEDPT